MARILIVDDSSFLARKMKSWFESENHEVVAIGTNGIEGEELYAEHKPDLTTLDITMPMKDGRECLKSIKKSFPGAKVLMISALNDKEIVIDCLNEGALGFIEKPLEFSNPAFCNELRNSIQLALK